MQAGTYRHLITFTELATPVVRDEFNQAITNTPDAYTDVLQVWARISPKSNRQIQEQQASTIVATGTFEIECRYSPLIKTSQRIRYGAKPSIGFDTLTEDQFILLSDSTFDTMGETSTTARNVFIDGIRSPDERRRNLIIDATEVRDQQ